MWNRSCNSLKRSSKRLFPDSSCALQLLQKQVCQAGVRCCLQCATTEQFYSWGTYINLSVTGSLCQWHSMASSH